MNEEIIKNISNNLNIEINMKYKDLPESERQLLLDGRILKSYFDKKCEVKE